MKYQPGKGVVSLDWKQGQPSESEQYGQIIVETWKTSLSLRWYKNVVPYVSVHARIRAMAWDRKEQVWNVMDGDAYDSAMHGAIKRWARLLNNTCRISITVDKWL